MKRIQVKIDGQWKYLFCYCVNQGNKLITTDNRQKALKYYDLEYFQSHYANDEFRLL